MTTPAPAGRLPMVGLLALDLMAPAEQPATPANTPVPGGGSWRWSDTAPHWLPNTPAPEPQPLQPGDTAALQTTEPTQE